MALFFFAENLKYPSLCVYGATVFKDQNISVQSKSDVFAVNRDFYPKAR